MADEPIEPTEPTESTDRHEYKLDERSPMATNHEGLPAHPMAVAALTVGVVSVCVGPVGLVAVVLGVMGLRAIDQQPDEYSGRGQAVTGIVLGGIGLMLMVLAILLLMLAYSFWGGSPAVVPGQGIQAPAVQGAAQEDITPTPQSPTNPAKPRLTGNYYYDLNTGKLFVAATDDFPPIEAPSGPAPDGRKAGVRAYVFSCGDCDDPTKRFIGYVMRRTEGMEVVQDHIYAGDMDLGNIETHMNEVFAKDFKMGQGLEFASPQDLIWHGPMTPEGRQLMAAPLNAPCPLGLPARKCD